MDTIPRFEIEVTPVNSERWRQIDPVIRLRRCLKAMLRVYGLRVSRVSSSLDLPGLAEEAPRTPTPEPTEARTDGAEAASRESPGKVA